MNKLCLKCNNSKDLSYFHKSKTSSDGHKAYCKLCVSTLSSAYREKNKDRLLAYGKTWRQNNVDYANKYNKEYYEENKEKIIQASKKYYQENKEDRNAASLLYYNQNKEHIRIATQDYKKRRKKEDKVFYFICLVRSNLYSSFRKSGWAKNSKTQTILGCSFNSLQQHLINSAKRNYNGKYFPNRKYEIDHITPISLAKTEEDVVRLNHYSNLQLLLEKDNRDKSNKLGWTIDDHRRRVL